MRVSKVLTLLAFFQVLTFGQNADTKPSFDVAAVYSSSGARYPAMRASVRGDRFEIKTATIAELIGSAYGVETDKVLGGPSWLDTNRFDVIARVSANTAPQKIRLMLRSLLAERFGLVIHNDKRSMPGWVLLAGSGKPGMKQADTSEAPSCRRELQPSEGAVIPAICHAVSMQAFAQQLRGMAGDYLTTPVVDETSLAGTWDFTLKWTPRSRLAAAGGDGITVFDAISNQIGLKLESKPVPTPVIVIDSVTRTPTQNPPEAAAGLPPAPPPQFEVATIKPTDPQFHDVRIQTPPNGVINIQGVTLGFLIQTIWFMTPDMIVGAPKWLDTERWDILAKISAVPGSAPETDMDSMIAMVRALLEDRFKLKTHVEERIVPAYTLTAVKPRLQKADPANRTGCKEGLGADAKDPRLTKPALSRLVTCRNITMAEFASQLPKIANALNPLNGPIRSSVIDSTGLRGNWDFTFNFSPELGFSPVGAVPPAGAEPSDPNGSVSLPEALARQSGLKLGLVKRRAQVVVIDHIERNPADN